jgi:hypothetical protein
MWSTRYSCPILIKFELCEGIFEKNLFKWFLWKPIQWEPSCSMRTGRRINRHDEADSRFSQFWERVFRIRCMWGLLKKRRDFLNSAPTSTESALRLLSAPSARFSGCSSTTNYHSETGQMAVCCHNLTLGALSSCSALSMLVGALFKKARLFFNNPRIQTNWHCD